MENINDILPDYSTDIRKLYQEINEEIDKIRPRTIRLLLDFLLWSYTDIRNDFEYARLDKQGKIRYIMKHLEVSKRTAQDYEKAISIIKRLHKLDYLINKQLGILMKMEMLKGMQ